MAKECYLYEKKENKKVRCNACNHRCLIKNQEVGICGVRKNVDGKLYLAVYEKIVGLNVDPIEKKPLFHFLPGTEILSFGTVGCNFRCLFCQNWDISQVSRKDYAREFNVERTIFGKEIKVKEIVDIAVKNNIQSIAYTYNEPAVFFELAFDVAKIAHEKGIKNVYVSNGFETKEAIEKIAPYLDAINVDLKSFSNDFYRKVCGGTLKPVLETIKRVHKLGIWMEITTLIIPGYNDSEEELKKIAEFIKSVDGEGNIPWHVTRFHPMFKMTDVAPTPIKTLEKAYEIGKEEGLKYVYVGNIRDEKRESTYCWKCNEKVIERNFYGGEIKNHLERNKCPKCGSEIHGVFK